ncbi:hypothetical protein HYW74_04805 [Candidatus Pacearchaeota archaeon]|nr:hypothetical protein [Candidatus Pacearchaeota archaeon]
MLKNKEILLIFIAILVLNFASAQVNLPNQDQVDKLQDNVDEFSDSPADYLKQEWGKMIEKSWIKGYLDIISSFMSNFDPVFEILLGMKFSFSWLFFITLFLYLFLLIFIFQILYLIELFAPLDYSKYVKWLAFLGIFIIISTPISPIGRIPKNLAFFIANYIGTFKELPLQIVVSLILIIALIMLIAFSESLTKSIIKKRLPDRVAKLEEKLEEQKKKLKKQNSKALAEEKKKEEKEDSESVKERAKYDAEGSTEEI